MEKNIEEFISNLTYENIKLIKQVCEEVNKDIQIIEKVNEKCSYYLNKHNSEENNFDNTKEKLCNLILETKNASYRQLNIISEFFKLAYVITMNSEYFTVSNYLNIIIYIKEQLESVDNDNIDKMELELFEFYIKRMDKSVLKDMNRYFEKDLEEVTEKIIKKVYQGGI